jgi:hypothetical protein
MKTTFGEAAANVAGAKRPTRNKAAKMATPSRLTTEGTLRGGVEDRTPVMVVGTYQFPYT